jgi:O-antigen/teichoic acid export membrane protein
MLKNGLYNVLSSLIRLTLNFLLIPILIRLIGLEKYGLWAFVSTVVAVATLAEGGLSSSTLYFVSQALTKRDTKWLSEILTVGIGGMFCLSTVSALVIIGVAPWLVKSTHSINSSHSSVVIICLQLGAILVWVRMIQGVLNGIGMACERYGLINSIITVQSIFTTIGMIFIAYRGGGLINFMQWQLLIALSTTFVYGHLVWTVIKNHKLRLRWEINRNSSIEIVRYSLNAWFMSIGTAIFQQGDKLIVANLLGSKELGIYAAITSVTSQINALSGVVVQPLLPKLSGMLGVLDKSTEIKRLIEQANKLNIAVALGVGGGLMLLDNYILNIIFGEELQSEYLTCFRTAIVIYTIYSLNAVGNYILLGSGMVKTVMLATLATGIFSLLMIGGGAAHVGLQGAIIGNSGYTLIWILNLLVMRKFDIKSKDFLAHLLFPILLVSISVAANNLLFHRYQSWSSFAFVILIEIGLFAWGFNYNKTETA